MPRPGDDQTAPEPPAQAPTSSVGDSKRLSEILSDVFAEQERVAPLEMHLQQLSFFRKEMRHMVGVVEAAPRTGWTPSARAALESVLDTASDLSDALATRHSLPSFSVSSGAEMPFEEAGLGVALDDDGPVGDGASPENLELTVEGLKDEVQVIHESLLASPALADTIARSPDVMREMARGALLEFCSVLKELIDACLATLARVPVDDAPAPAAAAPEAPRPAPPGQAPIPAVSRAAPLPVPAPVASAPAAPPAAAAAPPAPVGSAADGPDYQHRSDEEAVRELQDFFNENSPEGTLLKTQEREFTRLVAQIVGVLCAGVVFTPADLATRIRLLRDTFAVRKRLHNNLTVREFKSFFGVTR